MLAENCRAAEYRSERKDTFLATVARYNELAEKGEDVDFGRLQLPLVSQKYHQGILVKRT